MKSDKDLVKKQRSFLGENITYDNKLIPVAKFKYYSHMFFKKRHSHLAKLSNEIGHVSYLNSKLVDQLKIQLGINQAMTQNLIPLDETKFDLWDYEFQVYSQWGEDGIINHILKVLEVSKPNCLEIGIEDFTECNTRFLAHYRNAKLYLVDSSSEASRTINSLDIKWKTHIEFEQIFVNKENINLIIDNAEREIGSLDLLSIDIDGNDYWILKEIKNFNFKLIILEYNSIFGPKMKVTVPYQENFQRSKEHYSFLFYGASLSSYIELLNSNGYTFIGSNRACTNAFFVHNKYHEKFKHLIVRDLEFYTLSNIRESRDVEGVLNYLSLEEGLSGILSMEVIDTSSRVQQPIKAFLDAEL